MHAEVAQRPHERPVEVGLGRRLGQVPAQVGGLVGVGAPAPAAVPCLGAELGHEQGRPGLEPAHPVVVRPQVTGVGRRARGQRPAVPAEVLVDAQRVEGAEHRVGVVGLVVAGHPVQGHHPGRVQRAHPRRRGTDEQLLRALHRDRQLVGDREHQHRRVPAVAQHHLLVHAHSGAPDRRLGPAGVLDDVHRSGVPHQHAAAVELLHRVRVHAGSGRARPRPGGRGPGRPCRPAAAGARPSPRVASSSCRLMPRVRSRRPFRNTWPSASLRRSRTPNQVV